MALWEGKSLDELRVLASGHGLEQDPFHKLLHKLAEQHRRDIENAIMSLQKENDRLRAELGPRHDADHGGHPQAARGVSVNSSAAHKRSWCVTPPAGPPMLPGMIVDSSLSTEDTGVEDMYPPDAPNSDDDNDSTASVFDFAQSHNSTRGTAFSRGRSQGDTFRKTTSEAAFAPERMATRAQLSGVVEDLCGQNRSKHIRHLRQTLNLNRQTVSNRKLVVDASQVLAALERQGQRQYSAERIAEILGELNAVDAAANAEASRTSSAAAAALSRGTSRMSLYSSPKGGRIAFLRLVNLLMVPGLPDAVDPDMEEDVRLIQQTLLRRTTNLEGLIENATQAGCVDTDLSEISSGWRQRHKWVLQYLDAATMVVVLMSLFVLGLSMDIEPNWIGWIVIEGIVCIFMACEVSTKLVWMGSREYICGGDRYLHLLDLFVTALACFDLAITVASYDSGGRAGTSNLTTLLRFFRTARILRLLQLMKSRTLKELADIFTGFVIGMPWLFWVMVILFITTYSVALIFRQIVGPSEDERFMFKCGSADSITHPDDPDCQVRTLYGEEFFGSVPDSMFTLFRCMIGDCSTRGGQALAAHFSASYGLKFQVVYSIGMIGVIFGLFNIITALFVEATLSGLKHSDVQTKYRSQYDRKYVKGKLQALVKRVGRVIELCEGQSLDSTRRVSIVSNTDLHEIAMSEALFLTVIQDSVVSGIFDDLDVNHFNREGLFDIFDTDGNGTVTLKELVDTLMHLRGEPQKSDAVASFMALRRLRDNFQSSMYVVLENQEQIIRDQQEQWQALRDELAARDVPRREPDAQGPPDSRPWTVV